MSTVMDMQEFLRNRQEFPSEELAKYRGKYIAWSPDGKKVIASDKDPMNVIAAIKGYGYNEADCVLSSVPEHDAFIGSGRLSWERT